MWFSRCYFSRFVISHFSRMFFVYASLSLLKPVIQLNEASTEICTVTLSTFLVLFFSVRELKRGKNISIQKRMLNDHRILYLSKVNITALNYGSGLAPTGNPTSATIHLSELRSFQENI